jgi:hypothetical protein
MPEINLRVLLQGRHMEAETIVISLELDRIRRESDLQPRETLSGDTIEQYAEAMEEGVEFPPVVVYRDDDGAYWLSQGFHRCAAAHVINRANVVAEVRPGTRLDAMWDAAGSNREFDTAGMRRSSDDRKRAVRLAIEARPHLSDSEIGRACGVAHSTVGRQRAILCKEQDGDVREVTRGNRTFAMRTGGIGRKPKGGDDNGERDDTRRLDLLPGRAPSPDRDRPGAGPRVEDLLEKMREWQQFLIDLGPDDAVRNQARSLDREQVEWLASFCKALSEKFNALSKIFEDSLAEVASPG